jgi:hypothetical protein
MLAYLLIELFLSDVVTLVWKTFGGEIEAQSNDENKSIARTGKARMAAYKKWSNLTYPLAFDAETVRIPARRRRDDVKRNCWELLAIISSAKGESRPLNQANGSWTTDELGDKFVVMTRSSGRRRVEAPLIYGALMHKTLPLAQERLFERKRDPTGREDVEGALGKALGRVLAARRIEFVPYHGPPQGQSARYAADLDWWIRITRPTQTIVLEDSDPEENEALAEANRCPTSPWDLPETLEGIIPFLHKTILPRQWTLRAASLGPRGHLEDWILDTYEWVDRNYDGRKPLHRMALLWSILFSHLLPRIGMPKDHGIPKTNSPMVATTAILNIPWATPPRKGCTERLRFVVMLCCMIISFFEPESPLRQHLLVNDNYLGNDWTIKHGL